MTRQRASIFGSFERTSRAAARHAEPVFDFYDRVAGEYWTHPRRLIQDWADHIRHDADYHEIRQRIRSRDDSEFRSAFLELYLHECLVRAGWDVTIHPDVEGSTAHPDFLAMRADESMYLEAVAPGVSKAAKGAAGRRAVLLDVLNEVRDPNFLLGLLDLREGPRPPKSAALRSEVRKWLEGLDPERVTAGTEPVGPTHTWPGQGWEVTVRAIPIREEFRETAPDRSIGYYGHHPVSWIDHAPIIQKALSAKDRAYGGDLGAPFLIAVGTYYFDHDRWHSMNALYGHDAIQLVETADGGTQARSVRQPDGYFGTPPEWKNKNVSGVLIVNQLAAEYVQRAEVTLWRHPSPHRLLPQHVGFPGSVVELDVDHFKENSTSKPAAEFLGLVEPWPPADPWSTDM